MKPMPLKFATIPEWTHDQQPAGIACFFSAIALAGLEMQTIRLSAADQRKLLGHAVFGNRAILVRPDHVVESMIKVAFGMDYESCEYSSTQIQVAAQQHKQLCPGRTGPQYM